MNADAFRYAANMTNELAVTIPEKYWDTSLVTDLGTLRKLFIHMIRVRDIYANGIQTGIIEFPGSLPENRGLLLELKRSTEDLAITVEQSHAKQIQMGDELLKLEEVVGAAIQHEGIHQGQYHIALKNSGLDIPELWKRGWNF
ncbi:damage-inducible protein DinB [Tenuibacillus multivorans]|uniref:DinB family protein n=1 Tax=Tenuibacillus multivorans TaxID=237069 RepID=A0A1H0ANR5_9BACI|nr:damage-inducible protein DinB [Tenuibacillus multivorans]GEL78221.1 hypothetical protein TMU01_24560 [Tenuibacillus multivorans]SDN35117.1 hypothetical protein SAMN05216498_2014 [Tenuibacillus multivorans]